MADPCGAQTKPSGGLILVADDDSITRRLLKSILEAEGHRVAEAANGRDALDQAQQCAPDVVLLDIRMPGLGGLEVCRRLKQEPRTAPIPVLLVTGLTDREARLEGIQAGADDFLTKPIDREELILRVRNAVSRIHLYRELERKYEELKTLAELRDSLTRLIEADTDALAEWTRKRGADAHPPVGPAITPPEGEPHG